MTTLTSTSRNSQTQEQLQEINEKRIPTVSIGVGQDTTPVVDTKQQATSTTVGDECVSYESELSLNFLFFL